MALNIGKKIIVMIFISIVLTGTTMLGSIYFYRKTTSDNLRIIKSTNEALLSFQEIQLDLLLYKNSKDTKLMIAAKTAADKIVNDLSLRSIKIQKSGNQELITKIEETSLRFKEIQLNTGILQKGFNELALTKTLSTVNEIGPKLKDLISLEEINFDKETQSLYLYMIGVIILMAIIIVAFSLRISQSVVVPIQKLISASISSSKGDLTQTIKYSSKDEMGALANAFNMLVQNLAKTVTQLRNTSEFIAKHSGEFSTVSGKLNDNAVNITNSVHGIAKDAYIQKKQVDKMSQAIENMLTSITRVATRAQTQAEKTIKATEIAKRGSEATKSTINKMTQVNATVNNSTSMAKKLQEKSNQIELIVQAITKIAEQTNLLAINTAIEAARAGEGAREFRVIADEVRKLAEASGKAAEQIIKLLKEIQIETNNVISATETGAKEVTDGVSYVNRTGESLDELARSVWDISNLSDEISKATREQVSGIEEVRKAMGMIASISIQNDKTADDSLTLSQGQVELTKKIFESSSELKKLSVELVDLVKQFKV